MKKVVFGLIGAGALLLVFGFIIWNINAPNFEALAANSPENFSPGQLAGFYRDCLFGSQRGICHAVGSEGVKFVPFINIAGILLSLAGGGLFLFDRQKARRA